MCRISDIVRDPTTSATLHDAAGRRVQKEEESSATMTRDMPLVFETFLERLSQSVDEADFRDAMAEAAARLNLLSFAYLSLPSQPSGQPRLI
ncbi:hypothetical protein MES5069_450032 [Mesorhizobium escarrei]|uniref:Uncharacterized protein n=1 Tax=Mesorhizobium escarrei TaxID=666018 RepID=A0ABN8K8R5_9HYPH|nr:hypothetical protein MES5069_450032 [Mesorhizobium escarrei]